jgi:hypothetical protein
LEEYPYPGQVISLLTPFPKNIFVVNTLLNNVSEQEKKNGWHLLFDGVSSKGWKGAYQKGFPEKGWLIKEGELIVEAFRW